MRAHNLMRDLHFSFALTLVLITAPLLVAQDATNEVAAGPEQLYHDATASKTVEACTQVIARLNQVLSKSTDAERRKYYTNLLAWVYNRRGEMHAHDAATLAAKQGTRGKSAEEDKLAAADFKKSLELAPDRWKSWHNLAVCDAVAGRLEQALANFSKVIEMRPDYTDALFNRAEVYFELEQYGEAVNDYSEAIRLQPNEAEFYARRGSANYQLRQLDLALADYDRAVQLAPLIAEFVVDRGDVFRATGQWEKAAAAYRQAISLDKQYGRAYQSAAWLMATCPDARVRDARLATEAAEKAISLDGDGDFVYLDTLAAAYANAVRFDEAVTAARRAIGTAPQRFRESLQRRLVQYRNHQPFRQVGGNQPAIRQAQSPTQPSIR